MMDVCNLSMGVYQKGYDTGYNAGYDDGYNAGYNAGYDDGILEGMKKTVSCFYDSGMTVEEITDRINVEMNTLKEWLQETEEGTM